MSSRLGSGLWRGGRFVLPEHDEALRRQHQEDRRKPRPNVDDQEIEQIERAIEPKLSVNTGALLSTWSGLKSKI